MTGDSTRSLVSVTTRLARMADAGPIAAIYNQGIAGRDATFETEPRSEDDVSRMLEGDRGRFPVVVAEADDILLGWAGITPYRDRACYRGIGEFSIYIERHARRRGVGKTLLARLIAEARERSYWKLVSRIFPSNTASLALCRSLGFREVGTYEKHGRLEGRWMDVVIVERLISGNQV